MLSTLSGDNTWSCVERIKVAGSLTNKSAPFAVGDCISLTHTSDFDALKVGAKMTARLTTTSGFPGDTMGDYVVDSSCQGLRLLSTRQVAPSAGAAKPGIACPDGQAAVLTTVSSPDNTCTTLYAKFDNTTGVPVPDQLWEKNGLLCYPVCKDGYYGSGPVCWASCQWGDSGGVYCTRDMYQPHVRFVSPFSGCEDDEYKNFLIECVQYCKEGYANENAVVDAYCAAECPPNTIDAGLTCTKMTYGRGVGNPSVTLSMFIEFIGESFTLLAAIALLLAYDSAQFADGPPKIAFGFSDPAYDELIVQYLGWEGNALVMYDVEL
jgi:hypothetical protein